MTFIVKRRRKFMSKIHKIEAMIPKQIEKKKVAAYARVSALTEMTQYSFSAQVNYYSALIQKNPNWKYVGVYADKGITGRSIKKRKEFNRLIDDCNNGKIDLILTKSVSRFARDTVDTLNTIRHLKNIGVDVYFEKENIHSISQEGELLLTFLAAYAQAESENTSENIKWGIRKGFKVGKPNGYKAPYGYKWNGNSYSIVPEQGAIVKEIYKRYLDGEPAYSIAKALKKRGIKGQTGIPMDDSTIRYIVSNISYTGTLLLQKWFFTQNHVRKENKGELPMYAVENMFEPLISKEDFQKALQIKKERAEAMPNKNPRLTAFSGIVKCGNCGCSVCRRTTRYGKKWVCNAKDRKGMAACDFRDIYEIELEAAATKALAVNEFKEDLVRREVKLITIDNAYIVFDLKDGKKKQILRTYTKGYSGFSCRLFCGNCRKMLEADSRTLSINGQKKRYKIWCCRKCPGQREFDDVIRKATQSLFNEPQCEGLFAQNIEKAIIYNDKIDFYFKEGKVITWEKE